MSRARSNGTTSPPSQIRSHRLEQLVERFKGSLIGCRYQYQEWTWTWIAAFYLLFVFLWHGHWELPPEIISTIGAYCTKYQFDLQIFCLLPFFCLLGLAPWPLVCYGRRDQQNNHCRDYVCSIALPHRHFKSWLFPFRGLSSVSYNGRYQTEQFVEKGFLRL
jgi:hypothetical protein